MKLLKIYNGDKYIGSIKFDKIMDDKYIIEHNDIKEYTIYYKREAIAILRGKMNIIKSKIVLEC